MLRFTCALICALLVLSVFEPIAARKSFGGGSRGFGGRGGSHGYPSSGGLSGGGHHSYPSSGGLSGGGHGYPSSGGNHGYPSGGGHGYPSSGGLSGNSGSKPSYPSSGGMSGGGSGYPTGGKGLSGNTHTSTHTTTNNVHHHYHYSPPQQIRYTPVGGGPPVSYPVYHGTPPTYVYQYKDSGSKYGTLLTGLALFNLGALAGGAAGYGLAHSSSHSSSSGQSYKAQPGEVCKFGIRKDNGDYEETRIDCQLISSFILQEQAKAQSAGGSNTSVITTTVTNTTIVNTTNGAEQSTSTAAPEVDGVLYMMQKNGTLIPVNATSTLAVMNNTGDATNATSDATNTMTSSVSVTTTTTNTTVVNAVDVKGKDVEVTPGMKCYVIRNTPTSNMRKIIPCGVLQTYAEKSIQRNSAGRNIPTFTLVTIVLAAFVLY